MTGEDRTTPHVHDRFLVSCSCGWTRPTELDRLRTIEEAARAVIDDITAPWSAEYPATAALDRLRAALRSTP